MSYAGLLAHRCTIKRQQEVIKNGMPIYVWATVATDVKCFLDLNFIRNGKDPVWTPEAGRPADRSGVGFFLGTAKIKNADRVEMTRGPSGTFSLEMAVDEAWKPKRLHHKEVSVKEVPAQVSKGEVLYPERA